jgi:hypothetical protein
MEDWNRSGFLLFETTRSSTQQRFCNFLSQKMSNYNCCGHIQTVRRSGTSPTLTRICVLKIRSLSTEKLMNSTYLMFGPKRDEATGEWRKLHSGELHNLYPSPDIVRQIKSSRMRWAGHVARMGEGRKVYRVLVGKSEGKSPRRSWDQGVVGRMGSKWTLRRLAGGDMEWIHLAQDRYRWRAVVSAVMNLRALAPRS